MSFTVTATGTFQNTVNGLLLRVKVVTGAKPASSQPGGTASATGNPVSYDQAITISATGSYVYGAASDFSTDNNFTADSATTLLDNFQDTTDGDQWVTFRSTSTTASTGSHTYGATSPTGDEGSIAMAEILAATSLAEDASSPASVNASAASVTTAAFNPPAGSLLVAMVSANSGASQATTMAMSDTSGLGLTWTALKQANGVSVNYSGVFVAQMPGGGGGVVIAPRRYLGPYGKLHIAKPTRFWVTPPTSAGVTPPVAVSDSDASGTTADAGELIGVIPASQEASSSADAGESIAATLASQDTSGSNDQGTTVGLGAADASGTVLDAGEGTALSDTDLSGPETDAGEQLIRLDYLRLLAPSQAWQARFRHQGRPVLPPYPAALPVVTDSDTGHGTDAGESIAASLSGAETSAGTEASVIAATLASQDASGSDDEGTTVGIGAGDASGQAADGSEAVTAALSSPDAGSAAESGSVTANLSGSDTEAASEASLIAASLADSDASGSAQDAGEQLLHEDFNLGTQQPGWSFIVRYGSLFRLDKPSIPLFLPSGTITITDADHCLGEDAEIDNPGATDAETGHGTDTETVAPAIRDSDASSSHDGGEALGGTQLVSDNDVCHSTETAYWSGPLSDADAGHGTDLEVSSRTFTDSDACTGTDGHIVDVYAFQPPFRFTGGGFEVVKRPERAEQPPPRTLPVRIDVICVAAVQVSVTAERYVRK